MSAREQAREAAYERRKAVSRGAQRLLDSTPEGYADVASDVWEPLLAEARETIHHERCSGLLSNPDRGVHATQCWDLGVALGVFE